MNHRGTYIKIIIFHLKLKDFKSLNDGSKLTLTYMLWRCYLRHFTDNPPSLIEVVMINIDCES